MGTKHKFQTQKTKLGLLSPVLTAFSTQVKIFTHSHNPGDSSFSNPESTTSFTDPPGTQGRTRHIDTLKQPLFIHSAFRMPDMEQLFNQWARQAQEPENEDDERERVERFNFNHWARGPWDPEDSEDDNSDSEFGWGDCDGNHPDGEHCEICASSFDCYCYNCYANGAGDDSFHYYYRLFYWYYYYFYMEYYAVHYAERVTRGSQSRHDRDDYL